MSNNLATDVYRAVLDAAAAAEPGSEQKALLTTAAEQLRPDADRAADQAMWREWKAERNKQLHGDPG